MAALVIQMTPRHGHGHGPKRPSSRERRLKKLALQIAVQLPDDPEEALEVLNLAKTLVRAFVSDPKPA
jgi:hypothetical protein